METRLDQGARAGAAGTGSLGSPVVDGTQGRDRGLGVGVRVRTERDPKIKNRISQARRPVSVLLQLGFQRVLSCLLSLAVRLPQCQAVLDTTGGAGRQETSIAGIGCDGATHQTVLSRASDWEA